jgi:polyol transport system permease protein
MVDTLETTPTFDKPLGGRMGRKAAKVPLKGQELSERKFARKLIFPALVVAILITQIPFIATIYYSFQDWNLARPEERSSPASRTTSR